MNKKFLIGIVLGINLVVKLNHVKINQIAYLFINFVVTSVHVMLIFKVWSLRGMTNDVIWYFLSQSFSERN